MSGPRVEMLGRFGPYDGGWRDGEFHNPEGLASDSQGNVYVADEFNHRVQKLDPNGRMLWKVGAIGKDGRPRTGTAPGQFGMFRGVCIDDEDSLYAADSQNSRIQKFDSKGRFAFLFGSHGNRPGQMDNPDGVAVDSDGHIYVADTHTTLGGNHRVLKFDDQGRFLFAFGEHGTGPGQFAGKIPVGASEGPQGIDVGQRSGHVYVADTYNSRIQIFDREGRFLRIIGDGIVHVPRQLCLDSRENVYVVGFHYAPVMRGVDMIDPVETWGAAPHNRFLWVLSSDGRLLVRIGTDEADALAKAVGEPEGLFDHAGGRHHGVCVSKADESLVYIQCGQHILKYGIHW